MSERDEPIFVVVSDFDVGSGHFKKGEPYTGPEDDVEKLLKDGLIKDELAALEEEAEKLEAELERKVAESRARVAAIREKASKKKAGRGGKAAPSTEKAPPQDPKLTDELDPEENPDLE